MPPRFAYWTIILDGAPTSFRTKEREEILPLFNQLKVKNPGALLKWFSGGKLWDSPEQAREARELEKVRQFREERAREKRERPWSPGSSPRPGSGRADQASPKADGERKDASGEDPLAEFRLQHGRPADGSDDPSTRRQAQGRPEQRHGRDWRPGGDHRDPRDKYKLPPGEKRKRWKERNLGPKRRTPFGADTRSPGPSDRRSWGPGSPPRPGPGQADPGSPKAERPRGPKPFGKKPFSRDRWSPGPSDRRSWGSGSPPRSGSGRAEPGSPKAERPRGPKPFGGKPGGSRPRRPKPPGGPRRKG